MENIPIHDSQILMIYTERTYGTPSNNTSKTPVETGVYHTGRTAGTLTKKAFKDLELKKVTYNILIKHQIERSYGKLAQERLVISW